MKIISDTIPIIHELSKYVFSCTSSFLCLIDISLPKCYTIPAGRLIWLLAAKFQKRIFFYGENYYLYNLNRGVRGKCSWISSEEGVFQTYIDYYEAGGAGDPAERAAGFWQNGPEEGGCSPDSCSGGGRGRSGASIIPVPLHLDILYEDEDILVLNKPADMPVHPSAGNYENTLANGVAWYYQQQGEAFVYRCINRLDRDTTGVLVLAKNPLSGALLSAQMKQRQIRRTYLALTDGIPPERGTISAPVARMDASVITREVNFERGETAVTHYERLAVSNGYALVELHLDTGRTHQIRVHMKYIAVHCLGIFWYHPVLTGFGRQALHSSSWNLPTDHRGAYVFPGACA